jgi:hypothetical protein
MEEQIQTPSGPQMTSRQRLVRYLATGLANDLERGTESEQWTAALLHIVVDAVEHGDEAELVRLARAWRRELEGEG